MGQKQTGKFCNNCNKDILAVGSKPNHILHFILTICTLGVWGLVWILMSIGKIGGYRCSECGGKV